MRAKPQKLPEEYGCTREVVVKAPVYRGIKKKHCPRIIKKSQQVNRMHPIRGKRQNKDRK